MPNEIVSALFSVVPIVQDVLIVLLFIRGLLLRKKREQLKHYRLVSLSPILLWTGAICGGVLSVPVTLLGLNGTPDAVWYLFEFTVLVCIVMLLVYLNSTVTYDEKGFTASNLFGIKRTYGYDRITGILRSGGGTVLRCGRRSIRFDEAHIGSGSFILFADHALRKERGSGLPVLKRKKDPMNGNLDTPWLHLTIYLAIIAASIFIFILALHVLRPADGSLPADAREVRTAFSSYEVNEDTYGTIVLHAPDYEKPFSITYLSGYKDRAPDPEALCSGEEYILSVREGRDEYWIYAVSTADNRSVISAYDRNSAYRSTQYAACVILIVMMCVFTFLAIVGIVVGRHPERFSPGFRRLFYKDWAWSSSVRSGRTRPQQRRKRKRRRRK